MTLAPARIPLVVSRGATFWAAFRAVDDDGLPLALDDATAELYAFAADDTAGATPLVTLTTANGGIALGLAGPTDAITTLASGAAAGATVLTVASGTGIAPGRVVTVALDDGTRHVATVAAIAGATLTLSAALPSSAASGKAVTVYSAAGFGPANILLSISVTVTATMTPFVGWYHLDLIDAYARQQRVMQDSFCVEGGK